MLPEEGTGLAHSLPFPLPFPLPSRVNTGEFPQGKKPCSGRKTGMNNMGAPKTQKRRGY